MKPSELLEALHALIEVRCVLRNLAQPLIGG
jgi:hypothetical protein